MAVIHTIDHPAVNGIRVGRVNKNGGFHLTSSAIVYQLGDTTIDTGPSREWTSVDSYFRDRGIRQTLLTHHHEDHSGNARNFQSHYGTEIYGHPSSQPRLARGLGREMSLIRKLTFGSVEAVETKPLPNSVELNSGHTLEAHHLPGHVEDLCCFLEPNEGWLFTGDLYVASSLKYMTVDENVSDWIASLQRVLKLDFDTLFCSHRAVVSDGKKPLEKKLNFFLELQQKIAALHRQGYSERQIRRQLLGREDATAYVSLMHMSKANMVRAFVASLPAS